MVTREIVDAIARGRRHAHCDGLDETVPEKDGGALPIASPGRVTTVALINASRRISGDRMSSGGGTLWASDRLETAQQTARAASRITSGLRKGASWAGRTTQASDPETGW